jgi:multidrug resistance efflux pump
LCDSAKIETATILLEAAMDNYARVAGLSQAHGPTQPAGAAELSAARRGIAHAKAQLNAARQQAKSSVAADCA